MFSCLTTRYQTALQFFKVAELRDFECLIVNDHGRRAGRNTATTKRLQTHRVVRGLAVKMDSKRANDL